MFGSHDGMSYEIYLQQEWGQQESPCTKCPKPRGHNRTMRISDIRSATTFSYPGRHSPVWQYFDTKLREIFHDNTCLCAECLAQVEQQIADRFQ